MIGPTIEEIIESAKIHPSRVKNIYMFGSRLHGINRNDSDYDYFVIASTLNEHVEIKDKSENGMDLNIHVMTLDRFKKELNEYKMSRVESIFAPEEYKIMQKQPIQFLVKKDKIKKYVPYQSHESWQIAKSRIQNQDDSYRAKKSVYHSLRVLDYARQIIQFNKIVDFRSMNHVYEKLQSEEIKDWSDIKKEFFLYKIDLEKKLENS